MNKAIRIIVYLFLLAFLALLILSVLGVDLTPLRELYCRLPEACWIRP